MKEVALTLGRASAALEALLARAPHVAHRRYGEVVEDVPVEEVAVGDLLLVRPGELIPVDGTVLDGTAAVDASALTGEPVPVLTEAGDEVLSGTGANQFSGTRGASRLSVQNTVAASAPNALAVTIASGRSAYAYKQFRTGYTNYDLTLRLQLGATAWPRPGPAPNTAMDGDMVAAPWRYPGV
jgi:P-type E1-E2 ATPase